MFWSMFYLQLTSFEKIQLLNLLIFYENCLFIIWPLQGKLGASIRGPVLSIIVDNFLDFANFQSRNEIGSLSPTLYVPGYLVCIYREPPISITTPQPTSENHAF